MPQTITVLGIDPGSRVTGFGLVTVTGPKVVYLASGTIRTGGGEFAAGVLILELPWAKVDHIVVQEEE